jgi:hypothetical protein
MRYTRSDPVDGALRAAVRNAAARQISSTAVARGWQRGEAARAPGQQFLDLERAVVQKPQSRLLELHVGQLASCPGCEQMLRPARVEPAARPEPIVASGSSTARWSATVRDRAHRCRDRSACCSNTSAQAPGQMRANERCDCSVDSGCPRRLRAERPAGGDRRAWSQRAFGEESEGGCRGRLRSSTCRPGNARSGWFPERMDAVAGCGPSRHDARVRFSTSTARLRLSARGDIAGSGRIGHHPA